VKEEIAMTDAPAPPPKKEQAPVYLTNEQLLEYGRDAARAVGAPMGLAYCPQNSEQARSFEPHRWVLEAIQSAFLDGQYFARGKSSVRMSQYGVVPPNEPAH
jgi:hypothetical protein